MLVQLLLVVVCACAGATNGAYTTVLSSLNPGYASGFVGLYSCGYAEGVDCGCLLYIHICVGPTPVTYARRDFPPSLRRFSLFLIYVCASHVCAYAPLYAAL